MSDSTHKTQPRSTRRNRRLGFAAIAVLVCLLAISLIGVGMVQSLIEAHRGGRLAHDRLQSMWLAESGVDRALAQLASNADYEGETWTIAPEQIDMRRGAVVVIRIEATDDGEREAVVTATLGEGPHRVAGECRRRLQN